MTFNNKSILITGATGSFGKTFVKYIINNFKPKKIIIFSRDELKQYNMKQDYINKKNLRFFIGDIRDEARLELATKNVGSELAELAFDKIYPATDEKEGVVEIIIENYKKFKEGEQKR